MAKADSKIHYLAVGNPGVGKSTLLNNFVRKIIFRSGPSLDGAGVTTGLDIRDVPDVGIFLDTPGLNDVKMRKEAAAAISEALKKNGQYKVFFVVKDDDGRMRPDDLTTMKLVLEAAPEIQANKFAIIQNQVQPKWLKKMNQTPDAMMKYKAQMVAMLPRQTTHLHFIPRDDELDGEDDALPGLDEATRQFIVDCPQVNVLSQNVKDVDPDDFEAKQEKLGKLKEDYDKSIEAQEEQMKRMEAMRRDFEEEKQNNARREEELAKKHAEAKRKMEKETKEWQAQMEEERRAFEAAAAKREEEARKDGEKAVKEAAERNREELRQMKEAQDKREAEMNQKVMDQLKRVTEASERDELVRNIHNTDWCNFNHIGQITANTLARDCPAGAYKVKVWKGAHVTSQIFSLGITAGIVDRGEFYDKNGKQIKTVGYGEKWASGYWYTVDAVGNTADGEHYP